MVARLSLHGPADAQPPHFPHLRFGVCPHTHNLQTATESQNGEEKKCNQRTDGKHARPLGSAGGCDNSLGGSLAPRQVVIDGEVAHRLWLDRALRSRVGLLPDPL